MLPNRKMNNMLRNSLLTDPKRRMLRLIVRSKSINLHNKFILKRIIKKKRKRKRKKRRSSPLRWYIVQKLSHLKAKRRLRSKSLLLL